MKHPASLSSARDFRRVMAAGRVHHHRWGTIHVVEAVAPGASSRLGLAVPAKAGGSVQRNRIKRRLRAAFRLSGPAHGLDVVVRAQAEASSIDFQEMEKALHELES